MSSTLPLPAWADLATVLTPGSVDAGLSHRPWALPNKQPYWFARSAWSMRAIGDWWSAVHENAAPSIWLPDYFCNSSLLPLRAGTGKILFYPVDRTLEPDWEACRKLATAGPPDIFYLVHYFGRTSDIDAARAFCDGQGALMIEDAAHCLLPDERIGARAEFSIFSPYKLLPLPECGLLMMDEKLDWAQMGMTQAALLTDRSSILGWAGKRTVQKALPELVLGKLLARKEVAFADDPVDERLPSRAPVGGQTHNLIKRLENSLADHARCRRNSAAAWRDYFDSVDGCEPLMAAQEEGPAPYRFGVICESEDRSAEIFSEARSSGIAAESWPDLPPEVLGKPEAHSVAIDLRRRVVFFPTHDPNLPGRLSPR